MRPKQIECNAKTKIPIWLVQYAINYYYQMFTYSTNRIKFIDISYKGYHKNKNKKQRDDNYCQ